MDSIMISRALLLALSCACSYALTPLSAVGDDNDCALYLSGPGRTSAYDYSLNLLKGNFGYEGQHTCITYDAVNQAYLEARNRIVVSQPKGDWKPEDFASVGELVLDISINLARRYGLTYEEIEKGLPLIDTSRTLIREVCPPVFSHVECRAGKYRRLDGLCNNLQHPTWGATNAPFQRLIGPLFSDGINAPRIAHTGRNLPLSRVVSRTMHPDEGFHDHAGTVMVIAWGQFMDHDYTLTGTPLDPINRNDPEECCKRPPHLKHPYCNEIRIPDDDYFYRLFGVKCIDFVRGFPSPRPGCRLGSRVPFNTLTGAIDGNTVYGVTDKFSRKLRTGYGGLLRMNPVFKEYGLKDLLPLKLDIPDEGCTRPNKNMYCFEAGEIRVNEQLVLTVMHTLMAREHNRVAEALAQVNPHWDDETLFQEARRINIAEIQHITYNEFLPILLGKDVMEKFGLVLEKEGYWEGYDHNVNPDVLASFAAAAYRFGHSLLPTAVERWSKAHKFIASKRLSDLIRRPYDLYRAGVLDEYVMGLMNQVAQAMDDSITQEVTNHLFKKVGARFGMDLVSFNMQRGREFGLPGYMEFRKFCGLSGADSFQDLFGAMANETVRKYETIFEHPIDVDLWSGGVSERPLPGSMLGPTFACVIATQFSYSRRGDRFWFELPNQPSSFTPEQLAEIRKSRLARVICDNTDIIDTVQLYPMVLPDHELNPRVPCRSGIIPSMDFTKWAEPRPFHGAGTAKQFMTDAYIPPKNETNCEENINKTNDDKEPICEDVSETIEDNCGCNGTADAIVQLSDNTQINNTNINVTVEDCPQTSELTGSNCSQTMPKSDKSRNSDTILKYVYKKDDKDIIPKKSIGHAKNSLRKKRSLYNNKNVMFDIRNRNIDTRYAESVPLIVNYKTSHFPQTKEKLSERKTASIIRGSDLADFNIETLHENVKPHRNSQGIKELPKTVNRETKFEPTPRYRTEQREQSKETEESGERDYQEIIKDDKSNRNSESHEREEFQNSKKNIPYREHENSEREDYRKNGKSVKKYRENEGNERDEYRDNERNIKSYQEDENDKRGDYRRNGDNTKSSQENSSDENDEYRDGRNTEPYRKNDKEIYQDNKENNDSYRSTESDERVEYRENERNAKPYRKSASNEREDYRDNGKNNKPYREYESDESEEYSNNGRYNKPYQGNNSDRRDNYRDNGRNSKLYRENEGNKRDEYRGNKIHSKPNQYEGSDEKEEYKDSERNKSHEENESNEKEEYRDSKKNNKSFRESKENDEKVDYSERKIRPPSERVDYSSSEDNYAKNKKAPYSSPPNDSNESREIESEEAGYAKRRSSKENESGEKYYNRANNRLPYKNPVVENVENHEREKYKDEKPQNDYPVIKDSRENDYYGKNEKSTLRQPEKIYESEEEEAIIAIMKKKNRKPQNQSNISPIQIKDVDLGDFSYERIHVNNKGIVEPAKDTHENYETDSFDKAAPLTTTPQPAAELIDNDKPYSRSAEVLDIPLTSEIYEGTKQQININDGEVKPVVEINSDSSESIDENSKEAIKSNENNEDTSLETLLGVKIEDSDDQSDKTVLKQTEKGDVKQQFERIPLNYNHNKKEKKQHENSANSKAVEQTTESEIDDEKHDEGTIDILTPKDHNYDENLKIKFDDLTIKLPEIKLPKDILSYAYQEPTYDKNDQEKQKFFQYSDEYNSEEKPRDSKDRKDDDDYYYDDSGYNGYYGNNKKKDDYTTDPKKQDEDEDVDLYEKFVRERFGKQRPYEKKSEKLQQHATPITENTELFHNLKQILKKTEDIQKQAEKSGDPKAGYMWTLEYGQNL